MSDVDCDYESESTVRSQNQPQKCKICYRKVKDVIKCVSCATKIHKQCINKLKEFINININNWMCKHCDKSQAERELNEGVLNELNVKKSKYDLLSKLNGELETVNKLLKIKICELDKNYYNAFKVTVNDTPSAINEQEKIINLDLNKTQKELYSDKLKQNNNVLIIESKTDKLDLHSFKKAINVPDLGPGILNVRQTKKGKMIINCDNPESTTKIKSKLEKCVSKNCNVNVPSKCLPRIIICHAELEEVGKEILKENLLKQNNISDYKIFNICRFIKLKKSMHKVVETDPTLFSSLLKENAIFVG